MTAEDEICSVFDWAQRSGHHNIAAALRRALDKWPTVPATAAHADAIAAFVERGRRAQAAVDQAIAAAPTSATLRATRGKRSA
jgi:hypothetical protein